MDEATLRRLLEEAARLPDDEARQRWLDALPEEARAQIFAQAQAFAEAAFSAAARHLWAAEHIFSPLSQGEAPQPPLPTAPHPHPTDPDA